MVQAVGSISGGLRNILAGQEPDNAGLLSGLALIRDQGGAGHDLLRLLNRLAPLVDFLARSESGTSPSMGRLFVRRQRAALIGETLATLTVDDVARDLFSSIH